MHPIILYEVHTPGELEKTEAFGADILRLCVKVGGMPTVDHGVGVETLDLMTEMFNDTDLNIDQRMPVKAPFDPNNPLNSVRCFRNCVAAPNLVSCKFCLMHASFASRMSIWTFWLSDIPRLCCS